MAACNRHRCRRRARAIYELALLAQGHAGYLAWHNTFGRYLSKPVPPLRKAPKRLLTRQDASAMATLAAGAMTQEERRERARKAGEARWTKHRANTPVPETEATP